MNNIGTKPVIFLLLLLPIAYIFYSCCHCDIKTRHISYSHRTLYIKNLDNSGEQAVETESLQINKNAYGIRLSLARMINTVACSKQINSIFSQPAYALSCECPPAYIYSARDTVVSIQIFTLNNFDNQHLKNSEITDCFRIAHSFLRLEDHVANMRYTYEYDSEEFFEEKIKIDLLLMTAPTINNAQQFKIKIVLSNRLILEHETPEIELL